MGELANCPRCGNVFVQSMRHVCQSCYQEEEEAFQVVYRFLSERENRESTMMEIVKATGIEEELIIKFIKEGRLRTLEFPKLAYPCKRCGINIVRGKLCSECSEELRSDLEHYENMKQHEAEQTNKEEKVYYTFNKYKK